MIPADAATSRPATVTAARSRGSNETNANRTAAASHASLGIGLSRWSQELPAS